MEGTTCPQCGQTITPDGTLCRACGWTKARASQPASDALPLGGVVVPVAGDGPPTVPANRGPRLALAAYNGPTGNSPSGPGYPVYPQGVYPPVYGNVRPDDSGQGSAPSGPYQPYPPYPPAGYPPYPPNPPQPGAQPPGNQQDGAGNGFPAAYPPNPPQYPAYPYPYYYVAPPVRRPKGETYALVVSWIVTVTGGLSIIGGLLSLAVLALVVSQEPDNLALYGIFGLFSGLAIVGGAVAIVSGISRIIGHRSRRFVLPPSGLFVALALLVLATGIVLWNVYAAPGAAVAVFPLTALAAILPSLAILAFTAQRLGDPSSRRHVWLSFFYGATLAPIVAIILEFLATLIIYLVILALGQNVGNILTNINLTPQNPVEVIAAILNISVTAAVVEEGVKPLAAVLIMRRLRSPAEAFLVGLAGGIGFNVFEATGYITGEQADWIGQAIGRSTAGLLHGVGAGMAALGWYYLINGKGVPLRWLRGFGAILYAMLQHAINNAAAVLLGLVPPVIGQYLSLQVVPGLVPFATGDLLFLGYDVLIFLVLLYVTGRLRRGQFVLPGGGVPAESAAPGQYPAQPVTTATIGGAR